MSRTQRISDDKKKIPEKKQEEKVNTNRSRTPGYQTHKGMKEIIKDKTNLDAYREQCCTRTGVCYTYWNEFFPKAIEFEKRGIEGVADNIKKCPIRNYRARVIYDNPSWTDVNIVNDKNRSRVSKLDKLVAEANDMTDPSGFTAKDFTLLIMKAYKLITGEALDKHQREILLDYC